MGEAELSGPNYVWSITVSFSMPRKDLSPRDLDHIFASLKQYLEGEGVKPHNAALAGFESDQSPTSAQMDYLAINNPWGKP